MRRKIGLNRLLAIVRWSLGAIALSALGLVTNPIGAEEPDTGAVATFFEPINVPLVSVDIVVTDRQGRPIEGLTQGDFEVFEDGRPMDITHFYAAGEGGVSQAQTGVPTRGPEALSQDLYLALYFDDTNVNLQRRAMALSRLVEFLDQPLPENMKTILVRFDGSLHVESDFSDQPAELLAAIDRIRDRTPRDYSRDGYAMIREMQAALTGFHNNQTAVSGFFQGDQGGQANSSQPRIDSHQQMFAEAMSNFAPQIKAYARQSELRNKASLQAFEEFVRSLRGVPGRKAVLWVGSLEVRPGESLFRAWDQLFQGDVRRQGVSPLLEAMQFDMTPDLRDFVDVANSHRVTLYTLGPLTAGRDLSLTTELRPFDTGNRPGHLGQQDEWGEEEAQRIMSDLTGGEMLSDSGDLSRQLGQIAVDLGTYYSLAYVPPAPGSDEVHKITVKVNRDGAELRYRRSYRDLGVQDRAADRTLAAAVLGVADNPLGITLEPREQEIREDGNYLVPVSIRIPIGGLILLPDADRHTAQVSVFSVVRDSEGRLSDVYGRSYPIEIDNVNLLTAVGQQAEFVFGLVLREGPHRIAIGVRDDGSSTESIAYIEVVVGADYGDQSG